MQLLNIISFENATMLWAFSSLLLLLLIYLVRPRPKVQLVPSLMFFFKDNKTKQKSAFLQKVMRNILFFIQLLALAFLSLATTGPYFEMHSNASSTHTVLIIDGSASSQAAQAGTSRFEKQIEIAKSYVGERNSIIMAQNYPVVLATGSDRASTMQLLDKLEPKDTQTNLGDAIQSAKEILDGQFGRIIVVSDFLYNAGSDLMVAKKAVENEGIPVIFEGVEGGAKNIAITNAIIDKHETQVFIRNYESTSQSVKISQMAEGKPINGSTIDLDPLVTDGVTFSTIPGRSTISLEVSDDLQADNSICAYSPLKPRLRILVVSNKPDNNLLLALSIITDIDYELAEPPIVPPIENFDVIILNNVKKDLILPGTFEDIKNHIRNGGGLLIMVQKDTNQFDFIGLEPVVLRTLFGETNVELTLQNELTKDISFSPVKEHFSASAAEGSIVLAQSTEGHPLLAYKNIGKGVSFFYGLFDEDSDFKLSTSYPIFISRLIHHIGDRSSAEDFNIKTGSIMDIPQTQVITPSQAITTSRVYFDESGFYTIADQTYCANIFDAEESDITINHRADLKSQLQEKDSPASTSKKFSIGLIILIIAMLVLAGELIFIRYRGDI